MVNVKCNGGFTLKMPANPPRNTARLRVSFLNNIARRDFGDPNIRFILRINFKDS